MLAGGQQLVGQVVVLAHQAGGLVAEGDHAGTGQGGDVDKRGRLEALRVGQCVAQDQAAFGVGVAHFDGLARHRGDHVGRAVGVAVDGVFHRRHHHHQVQRQLGLDRSDEGADDVGATAHVVLHLFDAALGLQVDATGIEGDALADQHVRLGVAAIVPLQHDQARAVGRTTGHGQQRAHAQRFHLVFVEDLGFGAVVLAGELHAHLGQVSRGAVVRRQVAQLAGELDTGGDGLALGQGLGVVTGDGQLGQAGVVGLLLAQGGGVAVRGVIGGDHRLADRPGRVAVLHRHFGQGEQCAAGSTGLQRAHGVADGLQVLRHAETGDFAEADHQHARGGHARQVVQQGGRAGLAGQVAALGEGGQAATTGGVQSLRGRGQGMVGIRADHQAIDGGGGRSNVVQGEFEGH